MMTTDITNAKKHFFQLVVDVNVGFNPITIVNSNGKNAVLISEDEWKAIRETLYLSNDSVLNNNLNLIRKNENWDKSNTFNADEEW